MNTFDEKRLAYGVENLPKHHNGERRIPLKGIRRRQGES
jgi:hypothetical protein